jgi:SAM-dependent methyltransferase
MNADPAPRPSIALAAYVEPLAEGRRVLVFGDATADLAERLLQRGARLVHLYDPDPARAAQGAAESASRQITYAPLNEGDLALRDGAFDVAIIEDVTELGDVGALLRRVKRALSARGAVFVGCPNPDVNVGLLGATHRSRVAIDYYSLYDAVSAEFEHVRMLGQTPFVGYAIVDFAPDGEPLPALDNGFVPGGAEEPEWFIALGSRRSIVLDEFSIVQLPFRSTLAASGGAGADELVLAARAAERKARERAQALEAENKRLSRLRGVAPPRGDAVELERLRRELKRRDDWIASLEARALAADTRADEVQSELEEAQGQLATLLETQAAAAASASDAVRNAEVESLQADSQAELGRREERVAELEARVATLQKELEGRDLRIEELAGVEDVKMSEDIAAFEDQLRGRGEEIQRLQRDVAEAERIGRELVRELEDLRAALPVATAAARTTAKVPEAPGPAPEIGTVPEVEAEKERRLDHLSRLNAEREADLAAARWTIQELEGRVARGAGSRVAELEEELERARAELNRQAALLSQLQGL